MNNIEKPELSEEEILKLERQRIISDAELLENGAKYKHGEDGELKLETTLEQKEKIHGDREQDIVVEKLRPYKNKEEENKAFVEAMNHSYRELFEKVKTAFDEMMTDIKERNRDKFPIGNRGYLEIGGHHFSCDDPYDRSTSIAWLNSLEKKEEQLYVLSMISDLTPLDVIGDATTQREYLNSTPEKRLDFIQTKFPILKFTRMSFEEFEKRGYEKGKEEVMESRKKS